MPRSTCTASVLSADITGPKRPWRTKLSRTRAKGTAFETEVVNFLKESGFLEAHRNILNSPLGDIGDIPIVAECKNQKTMTISEWVDQAKTSGQKAGKLSAVIHKRRGKNVSHSYVTMELREFVELLMAYDKIQRLDL